MLFGCHNSKRQVIDLHFLSQVYWSEIRAGCRIQDGGDLPIHPTTPLLHTHTTNAGLPFVPLDYGIAWQDAPHLSALLASDVVLLRP